MIINSTASNERYVTSKYDSVCVVSKQRMLPSLIVVFLIGFSLGLFSMILSNTDNCYLIYSSFKIYHTQNQDCNENSSYNIEFLNMTKHKHNDENRVLADKLFDEVKVLCLILTSPDNHKTKAQHIKLTWGKRCNKLIFMSTKHDEELGAIGLDVNEGRDALWNKTKAAYTYAYENHLNEYDWFLKADDDTYVIMENLRFMLSEHNPDTPIWFGNKFKYSESSYMVGGAGYVLSREAVKYFNEIGNTENCPGGYYEDVQIGLCLNAIGVIAGDSRDEEGKSRFHQLTFWYYTLPNAIDSDFYILAESYYKYGSGIPYVSDKAISFHYISPPELYICEYLIYHVKPYGIWSLPDDLPEKQLLIEEEVEFLKNADNDRKLAK